MGNQQMCCNYKDKDIHDQDFDKREGSQAPQPEINNKASHDMDELLNRAKKSEKQVIKM